MLTYKIESITYNGVSTIGGKYIIPKEIGTVRSFWTNYEGVLQKIDLIMYPTFLTHQST